MHIALFESEAQALRARLHACEDAQEIGPDEYAVDLYECEPPLALELAFTAKGIEVLTAEAMAFDEELNGWYLAGPFRDMAALKRALDAF